MFVMQNNNDSKMMAILAIAHWADEHPRTQIRMNTETLHFLMTDQTIEDSIVIDEDAMVGDVLERPVSIDIDESMSPLSIDLPLHKVRRKQHVSA